MALTTNFLALWPGTHATIPANWERATEFDDRFFEGDATAGTDDGATIHTHTGNSHGLTGIVHVHRIILGQAQDKVAVLPGRDIASVYVHSHTEESPGATITYGSSTFTVSDVTTTRLPPYFKCIFIKPSNNNQELPVGSIGFGDDDTILGADWKLTDGNNGTDNLVDRFVLAPTTGADGGGTGGSLTHIHTSTGHSGHAAAAHNHPNPGPFSSGEGIVGVYFGRDNIFVAEEEHHDLITVNNASTTVNDATITINSASNLPAYYRLLAFQNKGASASTPDGIFLLFTGTSEQIPGGWDECDGTGGTRDLRDRQVYITATSGEIGDTGGSNTHLHDTEEHVHTTPAHPHTFTCWPETGTECRAPYLGDTIFAATSGTAHQSEHSSWGTMENEDATTQGESPDTSTTDVRHKYRTVLFVRKSRIKVHIRGGSILGAAIAA